MKVRTISIAVLRVVVILFLLYVVYPVLFERWGQQFAFNLTVLIMIFSVSTTFARASVAIHREGSPVVIQCVECGMDFNQTPGMQFCEVCGAPLEIAIEE